MSQVLKRRNFISALVVTLCATFPNLIPLFEILCSFHTNHWFSRNWFLVSIHWYIAPPAVLHLWLANWASEASDVLRHGCPLVEEAIPRSSLLPFPTPDLIQMLHDWNMKNVQIIHVALLSHFFNPQRLKHLLLEPSCKGKGSDALRIWKAKPRGLQKHELPVPITLM